MAFNSRANLSEVSVKIPFGIGEMKFKADDRVRESAGKLYVELATRVAIEPLPDEVGTVREALNSLYALFATTRDILKDAGPSIGDSVALVAIRVLNKGIRPVLSKWHPLLCDWEAGRPPTLSSAAHEREWEQHKEARAELARLRKDLEKYATALAKLAGVRE